MKVWWRYNNSGINGRQLCTKNKCNETNGLSIICSYIWHINSLKVWRRYVVPNTNAVHSCDIFFRHRAMFLTWSHKESQKLKILPRFATSRKNILYPNGLYLSICHIKIRNICLSVTLEFCLWSVACLQPTPSYVGA